MRNRIKPLLFPPLILVASHGHWAKTTGNMI
jgi:hypothetical protein